MRIQIEGEYHPEGNFGKVKPTIQRLQKEGYKVSPAIKFGDHVRHYVRKNDRIVGYLEV